MSAHRPDELTFRQHLVRGAFQDGLDRGRWRLVSVEWPVAIITVTPATREGGPDECFLRFDLTNYPASSPTAVPWNVETNTKLEFRSWPSGGQRVNAAFNPGWQSGVAIYIPCDRLAIAGHDQWPVLYPDMIWKPTSDITHYLRIVYELLNSKDYSGPRGS